MFRRIKSTLVILLGLMIAASLSVSIKVSAQTSDSEWTSPVNLSNSGGTSDHVGVMDEAGVFHVIWTDTISGYMYTRFDGVEWTEPETVSFPFDSETTIVLKLLNDGAGRIHAFWVEEINDTNYLYYSYVPSESFSFRGRWTSRILLASNVVNVEPAVDSRGGLHVLLVQNLDTVNNPAGIYYRRSANGGYRWSAIQQLYTSPYYRDLTNEETNLSILSGSDGESDWVEAAWDNQPRELVLASRSVDGGTTWESPTVIDGPIPLPDSDTNFQVELGANGQNLLMLWESGIPGQVCSHSFLSSSDGGLTWTSREKILGNFTGCLDRIHFFTLNPDLTILAFRHRGLPYLMAWDNQTWGDPILQTNLTELVDPATLNQVSLGCLQMGSFGGLLTFVGCDDNGKDIWASSRSFTDDSEWYPPPPLWSSPEDLTSTPNDILSPGVLVDPMNHVHVFWVQGIEQEGVPPTSKIFYTRLESGAWSTPKAVLASPDGDVQNLSMALDPDSRIHLVWTQGETGKLFYSWANSEAAVTVSEWSDPLELPVVRPAASLPQIISARSNLLYVIYSIPLNDGRGVYLIKSEDGGSTWSEPTLIFDGDTASWEMVGQPYLTVTGPNVLNAIWTRSTLPGGAGAIGLYSSRSDDGGQTWSPEESFVTDSILWSDLVESKHLVVHRVWQQATTDRSFFSYQESIDNGQVWSSPIDLSGLAERGPAALTVDSTGQLHLLEISEAVVGKPALNQWIWDGDNWIVDEPLDLTGGSVEMVSLIGADAGTSGLLGMVLVGQRKSPIDNSTMNVMVYTDQMIDTSGVEPIIIPTLTSTAVSTAKPEITPSPQPTPTIDFSKLNSQENSSGGFLSQLDSWAGTAIGIISAGLIVVAVFFIGLRRRRN